jgi:hypothetical protein
MRGPESWSLVSAGDSRSEEDFYNGFELQLPRMQDFLDPIPRGGGDAQVLQQSSKPVSKN